MLLYLSDSLLRRLQMPPALSVTFAGAAWPGHRFQGEYEHTSADFLMRLILRPSNAFVAASTVARLA